MHERAPPSRFAAHGLTVARMEDGLLQVEATGPFNLEGMQLLARTMVEGYRGLPPGTPVVNVCAMHGTLIYTPDAWAALGDVIRATRDSGVRVLATVWIVGREVEGAALLLPRARGLFAENGRRFEVFSERAPAERWARDVLAR